MVTWYLVFWLHYPENSVEHAKYRTERECRDAEYSWQRRLKLVGSQLVAECRRRDD